MAQEMDESALERTAKFYGVSMDEARRRNRVMLDHGDDPKDPICVGCVRRPHEISGYVVCVMDEVDHKPTDDEVREYVLREEGTLNPLNGHFLCDECYIRNGQPVGRNGSRWRCP